MPGPFEQGPDGQWHETEGTLWKKDGSWSDDNKNAPPPPNYGQAAQQTADSANAQLAQQTQANRPNQTNAFGSSIGWTQGPDGQWTQSQQFGGPFAAASQGLQGQAAGNMANPFDFGQFGAVGTGDQARDQAIQGAYTQAASRLDPQWKQREEQQRTQLLNQGLTEDSEAYQNAMGNLGRERNDAYSSAMNGAIAQGTAAGHTAFGDNMQSRQQAIVEALRQRGMPMEELQQLQGFLAQPGFNAAGKGQGVDYTGAAKDQYNANLDQYNAKQDQVGDTIKGATTLLGTVIPFLASDLRAKENVMRSAFEVLPGVPVAAWSYRGDPRRFVGVIAQDLQRVAPAYVRTRADGLLEVNYAFLEEPHGH
jgi:hypothetical protein